MIDLPPETAALLATRGFRIAGGLFLAAAAAWLLFLDRRAAATRAFSVILVGTGLQIVRNAVDDPLIDGGVLPPAPFAYTSAALNIVILAATLRFVSVFPRARGWLGRSRSGAMALFGGAALLLLLLAIAPTLFFTSPGTFYIGPGGLGPLALVVYLPAYLLAAVVLADAWRREQDPDMRRSIALTAAGFLLLAGVNATSATLFVLTRPDLYLAGGFFTLASSVLNNVAAAALLPVVARWVWSARDGEAGGEAKLLLGALLGGLVAGTVSRLTGGGIGLTSNVATGLPSVAFAVVVVYGVLRARLFGIDVKVRWTISKSTIAAAFIAVFFVASEGAQLVFGSENPYVGLIAAGALVFAIAPLQRAADRLAEKAVPVAPVEASRAAAAPAGTVDERALPIYRAAVRAALRDGQVTRREEVHLGEIAAHLGLSARDAATLRHEVEDEERRRMGTS